MGFVVGCGGAAVAVGLGGEGSGAAGFALTGFPWATAVLAGAALGASAAGSSVEALGAVAEALVASALASAGVTSGIAVADGASLAASGAVLAATGCCESFPRVNATASAIPPPKSNTANAPPISGTAERDFGATKPVSSPASVGAEGPGFVAMPGMLPDGYGVATVRAPAGSGVAIG